MLRKKMVIHGKKLVGGYQIGPGTNFRHTFRKYLPDPPPAEVGIFVLAYMAYHTEIGRDRHRGEKETDKDRGRHRDGERQKQAGIQKPIQTQTQR